MGRPLTGRLVQTASGSWEASVPSPAGKGRVQYTFANREDADAWRAAAVVALGRGAPLPGRADLLVATVPAVDAPTTGRDGRAHFISRGAERFVKERYDEDRRGGASRAKKVRSMLNVHVLPFMTAVVPAPGAYHRDHARALVQRLAATTEAPFTLAETSSLFGVSERHLRRLVQEGKLEECTKLGVRMVRLGNAASALGRDLPQMAYAPNYIGDVWNVWTALEQFMVDEGVLDRVVTRSVKVPAVDDARRLRPPKAQRSLVPFPEVAEVASRLHLVHQLVLWSMRVLGLRFGEVYGLHVGDLVDLGHHGLVAVERQGGRPLLDHDEHGEVVLRDEKDSLKTEASVRVAAVPASLMELYRLVVEVFHSDPATGRVDLGARLVPGIQRDGASGQHGFRAALDRAFGAEDVDVARFTPKDMRASAVTDLSRTALNHYVRRRQVGHVAGRDVHDSYIRDTGDRDELLEVAEEIEVRVRTELDSLVVPTAVFPSFGRTTRSWARRDEIRSLLVDRGSLLEVLEGCEPLLDAREVAADLGMSETHARRLLRTGRVPTVVVAGVRRVRHDDLEALVAGQLPNLKEVAARSGVDYHRLYALVGRLGIQLDRDDMTGDLAVGPEAEAQLLAEVRRIDDLRARACTVHGAARLLRVSDSTVRKMLRQGELDVDPETDATGAKFITRASIERRRDL